MTYREAGHQMVFAGDALPGLRASLLSHAPNEAAALLLAGRAQRDDHLRLLVREAITVPPEACLEQEPLRVSVSPAFLVPVIKRARTEGWSLVLAHTHPFAKGPVSFSWADDDGERILMPTLFGRAPDRAHGALVLGEDAFAARVWTSPMGPVEAVPRVVECGPRLMSHTSGPVPAPATDYAYDRSVRAFGSEGQATLGSLRVAIVGLGGMGSIVTEQLAHLGIGSLILLDPDRVEATNLNRVVGANALSVGRTKVDVAADHVRTIRPDAGVTAIAGDVRFKRDASLLLEADLIFCCTDSHGSRTVLNQLAYQYMIPVIDLGVSIDARGGTVRAISGRAQMLAPGLPCLTCQNLLDPEQVRRDFLTDDERARDPYIMGMHEPQPAVMSLNGTVASLGVTMMLAAVTGFPARSRHQIYSADRGVVRAVESRQLPDCVVCSLRGALGRGDLWPMVWRMD